MSIWTKRQLTILRTMSYRFFWIDLIEGLFSSNFRSEDPLLSKTALFVLVTFTFLNQGQKCSKMKIGKKTHSNVTKKMKSKALVLIFGKSLICKSGLGFLKRHWKCLFWGPNSGTFGKSGHIEGPKNGTLSVGTKNPTPLWRLTLTLDDFHFRVLLTLI